MTNRLYVFLDESGNTGDVLLDEEKIKTFSGQPYFVLGGFGGTKSQLAEVMDTVEELKKRHRIPKSSELKGADLWPKRAKFVIEVFDYIYTNRIPLFVELIDKKYLIVSYILTYSILLPNQLLPTLRKETTDFLNVFADILYLCLSDETFIKYTQACKYLDEGLFEQFMSLLLKDVIENCHNPILIGLTEGTCKNYERLKERENLDMLPCEYFLPPEEKGGSKRIVILPHSTSVSNIIARLERYSSDCHFKKVHIVYDRNPQEKIITEVLTSMLKLKVLPQMPIDEYFERRYKYNLESEYTLSFADSKVCLPIQIADVIASSLNKIWREFKETGKVRTYAGKVFTILFEYSSFGGPSGINFVIPKFEYERLYSALFG